MQRPDLEHVWRELEGGRTLLIVFCRNDEAGTLRRVVLAAHPKVTEVVRHVSEQAPPQPGVRRVAGRHRR